MRFTSVAALAAGLALGAMAQDFHWNGRVNPGQTVEIKGVNGQVKAETAMGSDIVVDASKTGRRNNPNDVRVEVVPHAGGVTVCAMYPNDGDRPNECRPGKGGHMNTRNNDTRVDFVVRVPVGVGLVARTVNGGIEITNLRSDVDASTVNGSVHVSTSEHATASTVNGSVIASVGNPNATGALRFSTVNGDVEVTLPANISADVSASSVNGGISTDFPLTVSGQFGPRSIKGRIGGGGRELKVSTVNGKIALKRS